MADIRYRCDAGSEDAHMGHDVIAPEGETTISQRGYHWCLEHATIVGGIVAFPSAGKLIPGTILEGLEVPNTKARET